MILISLSAILLLAVVLIIYLFSKLARYAKEQLDTGGVGYLQMKDNQLRYKSNRQPHYDFIIEGPTVLCERCNIQVATRVKMGENCCVQC